MAQRSYWREADGSAVGAAQAQQLWAEKAYPHLVTVAGTYHAVITYKELAEAVQKASGVRTTALLHNWIGGVVGHVVREAHRRGDPPLTALVVRTSDGMVGEGYREVLAVAGQEAAAEDIDRENHAAAARLDCYRRFGAALPPGGGVPALAPRLLAAIERRRARLPEPAAPICPGCYVQLPATGICDSCQ
ncbi:hypothetical protein [Streptomyces sp. CB03911]|uniref:hypothetical protein n=1 Tax=Streptomyces sp. CB03911 TaxID=1804758 RepID=UPI00093DF674|nr:hypothetical protein [Streptomyces sp. CB03911]OKI20942.1 hypothetical protein A6A07_36355 [Streptomyces sp. CB03911]